MVLLVPDIHVTIDSLKPALQLYHASRFLKHLKVPVRVLKSPEGSVKALNAL